MGFLAAGKRNCSKLKKKTRLNCFKTKAMWMGSSRNCMAQVFGIKWPNEPILLHEFITRVRAKTRARDTVTLRYM